MFHAAQRHGVDATGITLSKNQFEYVKGEIAARGLADRVRVELRDYLDLPEDALFDKVASVGCSSTSGSRAFPSTSERSDRILKPGGFVLNHGITHNPLGAESLGSGIGDFVDEYVFPGRRACARRQGHRRDGGGAGARGDRRGGAARALRKDAVAMVRAARGERRCRAREVGEEKFRVWRIYLAGSAHAFERGWLSLWQLLAGKPLPDGRLPHPLTRAYMYPAGRPPRSPRSLPPEGRTARLSWVQAAVRALGRPPRSLRSLPPEGAHSALRAAVRALGRPPRSLRSLPPEGRTVRFGWERPCAHWNGPHAHCVRCPPRGRTVRFGRPCAHWGS